MKITLGWGLTWIYYNGKLTANTRGKMCLAWNVEGPVMYLIFLSISSRKKKNQGEENKSFPKRDRRWGKRDVRS